METFPFSLSFALILLTLLNNLTLSSPTPIFSSTTDRDALLSFKNILNSDPNSILFEDWSTNKSICDWTGVSCGTKHQRVTALNVSGFGLRGNLTPHLGNLTFLRLLDISFNNFTGTIPSELFNLRRLKALHAGNNTLDGNIPSGVFTNMSSLVEINMRYNKLSGQLPNDMCRNTPKLRRIYLTGNQLSGGIPTSIHNCKELEDLRLPLNQFSGSIPSEIGNLTKLTTLSLFSNFLQGHIPKQVGNLISLLQLNLGGNKLTGDIPLSVFNISCLELVDLSRNNLTGSIPTEIGYLTSLKFLQLSGNRLTGHIRKQYGNLTVLQSLFLSRNKLTGEIPKELGNLANIMDLDFSFNDFLSGSIPSSIFNLSTLKKLYLQQNQFSGILPPSMGFSLFNLEELYLYWNKFSGEIPTSITNASKLTMLELNNNSFTGSIPDFGNLRLLRTLRLWLNNLSGAESPNQELTFLSSLTNCRNLEYLEVSFNPQMNGILPSTVGNLSKSLLRFSASSCNIRGVIPSEIGNLSSLQTLDLSGNQLTGFIPTTMGKLKQLQRLHLYNNQLQGYIPRHLCNISNLGYLFLFGNMLTGPIPKCLGESKSLREVSLASNKLDSTLPSDLLNPDLIFLNLSSNYLNGQLPDQIGSLRAVNWLDLSSNKFSGNIPTSIDGCQSLEFLSLSNNMFNGSIPQSLGKVKGLRSLYLSNNNLSGTIPETLVNLKLIKQFNVSHNKLEGEIPDKGCFIDFTAESFLHNSALCGAARFQVSPCGKQRSKRVDLLMKYIIPPFVAVVILAVGLLILIRRCIPKKPPRKTDDSPVKGGWKVISERELKQGTNYFSETNLLGKGSFGSVFRATLLDGDEVAVKVFNLQSEGAIESFESESHILSTIRHRNLVKIIGCCSNSEFKALILAYMPNGSLEKWLYSDKYFLDLVQRLKIAIDVALALEYLHLHHTYPVVHRDIKPSNVLLDKDLTAHVGDFGISKLFDNGEAAVHTMTMATFGYVAPEFGSEGQVSTSGDVYSYGILLLEMFTSKKPTDEMFNEEMSIKKWVEKGLQDDAINEIVAPALLSREDLHFSAKLECVTSIFDLAMKCLAFSAEERINMKQVVPALHKIKTKVPVEEVKKKLRK